MGADEDGVGRAFCAGKVLGRSLASTVARTPTWLGAPGRRDSGRGKPAAAWTGQHGGLHGQAWRRPSKEASADSRWRHAADGEMARSTPTAPSARPNGLATA